MITSTQDIAWAIDNPPLGSQVSGTLDIAWAIDQFRATIGGSLLMSWRLGATNDVLQLVLNNARPRQTGVLTIAITSQDGAVYTYFPSTVDIREVPADTGRYVATIPTPDVGFYFAVWSDGISSVAVPLSVLPDSSVQTPLRITGFSEYVVKAGDLEPSLLLTIRNAGGTPVDLTGVLSVGLQISPKDALIPTVIRDAIVLDPPEDGQIVLDWQDGETDVPGIYEVLCTLNMPTNGSASAPSRGLYRFVIEA